MHFFHACCEHEECYWKTVSSMQCKEGVNASDGMALYRLQGGVDNCGTGAHPGAECHMECKDEGVLNEYLSGQRVIECGTNGEWSGPNLVCAERTTCNSSAISSNRTTSSLAEMGAPVLLSKKKCALPTVSLGATTTLEACAKLCHAQPGCNFFNFARPVSTSWSSKPCKWAKTASAHCDDFDSNGNKHELVDDANYDFFAFVRNIDPCASGAVEGMVCIQRPNVSSDVYVSGDMIRICQATVLVG